MSEKRDPKAWRCENGHILGVVTRNVSNISQLILYRHAIDMESEEPPEPDVMGVLNGLARMDDIRCDICGAVRSWDLDREAVRRFIKHSEAVKRRNDEFLRENTM